MPETSKSVVIGSDHGAVELKRRLSSHLTGRGYEVSDLGVFTEESVDYPDTSEKVCREFLTGGYDFGIVLCGTGIGASIAANKIDGIRCALIHDLFTATMAREHNNANILALGGRVSYQDSPESMLDAFIDTNYDGGGRHGRRVGKITALEK